MKTVLITGASSGIGKSLALAYAKRGYAVFAGGRNEQRLDALEQEFINSKPTDENALKGKIHVFSCDLSDKKALQSLSFKGKKITLPPLDILLLNAGDCEYIDDTVNFDAELFARVINNNLISVGYCLAAWLPLVKKQGQLVFTSSSAVFLPLPRAQAYGASKAALTYLAKSLSVDLSKEKIDVSVIHPGFVNTPLTQKNTFTMPNIISSEQATDYILRGLDKRYVEINFPKRFIFIMKLISLLPFSVWRYIANKMNKKPLASSANGHSL